MNRTNLIVVTVFVLLAISGGLFAVWSEAQPTVAQQVAALGAKAEGQEVTLLGAVIPEYNAVTGRWTGPVNPFVLPWTAGECETEAACNAGK